METKYRHSIALVIASVVLCIEGSEVKICDSLDHFICQAPGVSLMCDIFYFTRRDCPRLCRQCIGAATTQSTTTNVTVTPALDQLNSTAIASTSSAETTSAIVDNTVTTKVATEQSKRFNTVTKSGRVYTKTIMENQTLTTATADHIYPSFVVFVFIFTGLLQLW